MSTEQRPLTEKERATNREIARRMYNSVTSNERFEVASPAEKAGLALLALHAALAADHTVSMRRAQLALAVAVREAFDLEANTAAAQMRAERDALKASGDVAGAAALAAPVEGT